MCYQVTTIKVCSKCDTEVEWSSTVLNCPDKLTTGNCTMGQSFDVCEKKMSLCEAHESPKAGKSMMGKQATN